jgi:hypothetical protein
MPVTRFGGTPMARANCAAVLDRHVFRAEWLDPT